MHKNESYSLDNAYNHIKEKQTNKKNMKLKNSHLYLISIILNSIFIHSAYSATYYTTPGKFVDLSSRAGQSIWPSTTSYAGFDPTICRIFVVSEKSNSNYSDEVPNIENIQGYQGLRGSDNLIYIIHSTSVTSTVQLKDYKITFNALGSTSIDLAAVKRNAYCWDYINQEANQTNSLTYGKFSGVSAQRKVFVPDNTVPGTYPLKDIYFSRYSAGYFTTKYKIFDSEDVIVVMPPFSCTINTPPKINFGNVNVWDWEGNTSGTPGGNRKDVLGVIDGNFTINCTGEDGVRTPAKLTLSGTVQAYSNDLKMTMDASSELAPATVRASIKSIIAPCSTEGTSFNHGNTTPPANEVDLGELTVGSNQVPYRFSLCALGEGFKSGAASASATVTIDWE